MGTLISYPQWTDSKKLLDEVTDDPEIQDMIQTVLSAPDSKPGYSVKQGVLFYHGRLVLSPKSPSIPLMLEEFHCTLTSGHSGFLRTYRKLADNLYWRGMQKSVRDFVRACDVCQRQKYAATTPGGLLQSLPIPNGIWEEGEEEVRGGAEGRRRVGLEPPEEGEERGGVGVEGLA